MSGRSKTYDEVSIKTKNVKTVKSGVNILDNFLSNESGFIPGSSLYFTGTSGSGKTSLAYFLQRELSKYKTSLYSREMTASQIKRQMIRFGTPDQTATISDKESCPHFLDYMIEIEKTLPNLIIIDSLQFIVKEDYANMSEDSAAEYVIESVRSFAEKTNAVLIIIGHVNKDGNFAGSNFIKHAFDAHLHMKFDKKLNERTLYWEKNRLGSVEETLYYTFDNNTINFFTKEEWNFNKENKNSLSNSPYLNEPIFEYIKNSSKEYNKSHPLYKQYLKDVKKAIKTSLDKYNDLEVFSDTEYEEVYLNLNKEVLDKITEVKNKWFK